MPGGSAYRTHVYKPKQDDHGSIGLQDYRWHEGWFVNLYGEPSSYSSTMTADETFTDPKMPMQTNFLDPNGANRNFNPSGTFKAGFVILIKNIGTDYNIIFDSAGSAQIIRPGELAIMMYDGSTWR